MSCGGRWESVSQSRRKNNDIARMGIELCPFESGGGPRPMIETDVDWVCFALELSNVFYLILIGGVGGLFSPKRGNRMRTRSMPLCLSEFIVSSLNSIHFSSARIYACACVDKWMCTEQREHVVNIFHKHRHHNTHNGPLQTSEKHTNRSIAMRSSSMHVNDVKAIRIQNRNTQLT